MYSVMCDAACWLDFPRALFDLVLIECLSRVSAGPDGSSSSSTKKSAGGGGGGKCKRVRTIFTADQLERLEAEFERQQYMVGPERLYLAHALNLTEAQVGPHRAQCSMKTFSHGA